MKKSSLLILGLCALGATVPAAHGVGILTISEVYGGGGNAGPPAATFSSDFIEIFNPSTTVSVDLMGYSVQYASAAGASYQVTPLSTTSFLLAPQSYFLVRESTGTTGTVLPMADVTGTINLSATAGKVALVNNTTALTSATPLPNASIVDFIGYGTTASAFETAAAPAGSNILSLQRAGTPSGQTDTDNNSTDYSALTPGPMSSAVPEPSTYAMMAGGLGLLLLGQRARRMARA